MSDYTSGSSSLKSIPRTKEWTYDPHYPGGEEWSEEADEIYEERQAVLAERVYEFLCGRVRSDGYFRLDYDIGFDEIGRGIADSETLRLFQEERRGGDTPYGTWTLFRLREDVFNALYSLADDGRITWVVRSGWPHIEIAGVHGVDADRLHELRNMPYREYLQTPEWQQRRKVHLDAAGGRCQLCNRDSRLQVHHRTYKNRGSEKFGDLIVLCAGCHKHFHEGRRVLS